MHTLKRKNEVQQCNRQTHCQCGNKSSKWTKHKTRKRSRNVLKCIVKGKISPTNVIDTHYQRDKASPTNAIDTIPKGQNKYNKCNKHTTNGTKPSPTNAIDTLPKRQNKSNKCNRHNQGDKISPTNAVDTLQKGQSKSTKCNTLPKRKNKSNKCNRHYQRDKTSPTNAIDTHTHTTKGTKQFQQLTATDTTKGTKQVQLGAGLLGELMNFLVFAGKQLCSTPNFSLFTLSRVIKLIIEPTSLERGKSRLLIDQTVLKR